jgi:hypothetical protein
MSSTRICLIATAIVVLSACTRDAEEPPPVAVSAPDSAPVAERVAAPVTPPVAHIAIPISPTVKARVTPTPTPQAKSKLPTPAPDHTLALDWMALEKQLRSTKAIGIFSKIALKNQVDDFLKQFSDHYKGNTSPTIAELHRSYDLLMMKVLSLIQDHDQKLTAAIVSSREAIWALLADPKKFAELEV